jgi:Kef-type K+ transport system membrane component KefB
MVSTTQLIVDLTLLLAAAVIAGEIANRLGQAALTGQLLVGVILGPSLLGPLFGLTALPPELNAIQILATVFILFLAGLHIVPEQLYRMGPANILLGVAAFTVPFVASAAVVWVVLPGLGVLTTLFVALTLSITALPVMAIMLTEFRLNGTRFGELLMNTALVNELVAVSVFAVLLQLETGSRNGFVDVAIAAISVAIFILTMLAIHMGLRVLRSTKLWDGFAVRFQRTWRSREGGFALLMVLVLGAALYSQFLGLTFVVGAFYAGILVTEESAGLQAHRSITVIFDAITWGFFIPLFFAIVGVEMNLHYLADARDLLVLVFLLAVAVLTKVAVGYSGARLLRWPKPHALSVGYLITSRGAVELAMAVILLESGIFTVTLFTFVAAVGLMATIIAPIGALWSWESSETTRNELYERVPTLRPGASRSRAFHPSFPYGPLEAGAAAHLTDPLPTPPFEPSPPPLPAGAVPVDRPPLPDPPARPP